MADSELSLKGEIRRVFVGYCLPQRVNAALRQELFLSLGK